MYQKPNILSFPRTKTECCSSKPSLLFVSFHPVWGTQGLLWLLGVPPLTQGLWPWEIVIILVDDYEIAFSSPPSPGCALHQPLPPTWLHRAARSHMLSARWLGGWNRGGGGGGAPWPQIKTWRAKIKFCTVAEDIERGSHQRPCLPPCEETESVIRKNENNTQRKAGRKRGVRAQLFSL